MNDILFETVVEIEGKYKSHIKALEKELAWTKEKLTETQTDLTQTLREYNKQVHRANHTIMFQAQLITILQIKLEGDMEVKKL